MNITIVSHVDFWHKDNGAKQRVHAIFEHLRVNHKIQFFFLGEKSSFHLDAINKLNISDQVFFEEDYRSVDDWILDRPLEFFSEFIEFSRRIRRSSLNAIAHFVNRHPSEAYLVEYLFCGATIDVLPSSALKIVDTHDLLHTRAKVFQKNNRNFEFSIDQHREFAALDQFDYVLAIQRSEYLEIQSHLGEKARLVPHSIDFREKSWDSAKQSQIVGFFGGPNVSNYDALLWFLKNVWPNFCDKGYRLHVYGDVCHRLRYITVKNMFLLGRVENLQAEYEKLKVAVNPVQYGSGLKIKSIEALGNHVPLVATTVGVEGLPAEEAPYFVADEPRVFTESLSQLLTSETDYREHFDRCPDYMKRHYSREAAFQELDLLFDANEAQAGPVDDLKTDCEPPP